MKVPLLDLTAQYAAHKGDILNAVAGVLESQVCIGGPKVLELKRTPAKLRPLLRQKTLLCPECGYSFLALRGEVGILTEAHAVQ